jgi:hypothetical protein
VEEPELIDHGGGHYAACHHPLDREHHGDVLAAKGT